MVHSENKTILRLHVEVLAFVPPKFRVVRGTRRKPLAGDPSLEFLVTFCSRWVLGKRIHLVADVGSNGDDHEEVERQTGDEKGAELEPHEEAFPDESRR